MSTDNQYPSQAKDTEKQSKYCIPDLGKLIPQERYLQLLEREIDALFQIKKFGQASANRIVALAHQLAFPFYFQMAS